MDMDIERSKDWKAYEGREVVITDKRTGEILDDNAYLTEKSVPRGRDYWWRFLVLDLVSIMEDLPGRQMHAIGAILDSVSPYDNTIQNTQQELANRAGVSYATMNKAMKVLQEHGIIKMVHKGLWMIDPRFMSQGGGHQKFTTLAIRYDSVPSGNIRLVDDGDDGDDTPQAMQG